MGVGLRRDAPAFLGETARFTPLNDERVGPAPPDGGPDLPSSAGFSSLRRFRARHNGLLYALSATLIDAIALLHQYQREIKTVRRDGQVLEYVEVSKADIALANRLAHEVLGRSLDELPPPTRKLLQQLRDYVNETKQRDGLRAADVRFTRKAIRAATGLSNSQVSVHLNRLVELEYVVSHYGKNGQRYVYELVFNGETDTDQAQLMGLIDVAQLNEPASTMTAKLPAAEVELPASLRSASGADVSVETSDAATAIGDLSPNLAANATLHVAGRSAAPSQRNGGSSALAADALAPQE